MRTRRVAALVVGSVALLALPGTSSAGTKCSPDSVQVGQVCVDKYEASVWSIPPTNHKLIKKVQDGEATLAELTAGGASQMSPSSSCLPAFPSTFDPTGNWTAPFYAASVAGVPPTACVTLSQAEQACALSGKRLLTNQEWKRAAAGTPDPGTDNGSTDCNISTAGSPVNTGSRSLCVSKWGALDMVGNVWEWVADWVPPFSESCGTVLFGSEDFNCLAGTIQAGGTAALIRGGGWSSGGRAGVFAVGSVHDPSDAGSGGVGFRCAR